jgi:hypothetical protein
MDHLLECGPLVGRSSGWGLLRFLPPLLMAGRNGKARLSSLDESLLETS